MGPFPLWPGGQPGLRGISRPHPESGNPTKRQQHPSLPPLPRRLPLSPGKAASHPGPPARKRERESAVGAQPSSTQPKARPGRRHSTAPNNEATSREGTKRREKGKPPPPPPPPPRGQGVGWKRARCGPASHRHPARLAALGQRRPEAKGRRDERRPRERDPPAVSLLPQ